MRLTSSEISGLVAAAIGLAGAAAAWLRAAARMKAHERSASCNLHSGLTSPSSPVIDEEAARQQ